MDGAIGQRTWAIPEGYIPIPKDTDRAMLVRSDVPIVVQHTRLDSRQSENALLSTMAFPVGG
jgi:hypothetical protein